MSTKYLFAVSLLMPLMAISGMANAGPKITDKSYWPNETRNQQSEPDWRSAYGLQTGTPRRTAPAVDVGRSQCRYQGGPKLPMTCSR